MLLLSLLEAVLIQRAGMTPSHYKHDVQTMTWYVTRWYMLPE
jgi:hypothetical protein